MAAFPFPEIVKSTLQRYFKPDGREPGRPYLRAPMPTAIDNHEQNGLGMLGSFVEVFLAKEGHTGKVGVNLLTKVQLPNLASLYGSMLAGVDYVLMGAGIPREIPALLRALAAGQVGRISADGGRVGSPRRQALAGHRGYVRHVPRQLVGGRFGVGAQHRWRLCDHRVHQRQRLGHRNRQRYNVIARCGFGAEWPGDAGR